ncbi:thiopeptide-type bacteriocin biosynthesis protein [Streptomyces sp. BH055]|uniref:thiopeptide-type bacteriocin biosynthesis protein n=1 Tax=unclassified Streptomyces TaxID=2593676 RepID=UPI003BB6EB5A
MPIETTWCQANIAFPDAERAEATALTHLAPLLHAAEAAGAVSGWFFIRKLPCWRVRFLPAPGGADHFVRGLDRLAGAGHISGWTEIYYEPEEHAFGGAEAMECAHRLFHLDSRHLVDYLRSDRPTHRREVSLLLCSLLMRKAGLDWYEQGDVWVRVARHRALTAEGPHERLHAAVERLISVTGEDLTAAGGPMEHIAPWAASYSDAGHALRHLTDEGLLHRGLRDVVAHHVLFAWNRFGLPYEVQAALADAAKTVVFGPDPTKQRNADHVTS